MSERSERIAHPVNGRPAGATRRPASGRLFLVAIAAVGMFLASLAWPTAPARAGGPPPPEFCNAIGGSFATGSCGGPVTNSSQGISGSAQRQIEQRLQELRCKNDPSCQAAGGASADSVDYSGFSVFVSGDYEHKDKQLTSFETGYDSNSFGPQIGIDYRLGTSGVIGAAFDYTRTDGDYDNNYGHFNDDDIALFLYGSYFPSDQSFIDGSIGFGHKQHDVEHVDPIAGTNVAKADPSSFEFSADLSGGYDFSFGAFTIGPRAGLHLKHSDQEGFTETGTAANLFSYGSQEKDSLTSTIGFQASYAISTSFGVIVPSVNADYVHEFINGRETYTASSPGVFGGAGFNFKSDEPDPNYLNVGAGLVFVLPDGVSPFLSYQAELANSLEETHTVTGGVRVEF